MTGVRPIFSYSFFLRIRFRTYHTFAPHILPQSDMRRRMRTYHTSTNPHISLSENDKATSCGGHVVGSLPRPTPIPNPSYCVGSMPYPYCYRTLAIPLSGARHSGLLSQPSGIGVGRARSCEPRRLRLRSLAAWASAGTPTTCPPQIQETSTKQPLNFSGCTHDTY
jgi:hypothetical protein